MKKRLLSLVLVFSFIFGTLPVNALAGTRQTGQSEQKSETRITNGKADKSYRLNDSLKPKDVKFSFKFYYSNRPTKEIYNLVLKGKFEPKVPEKQTEFVGKDITLPNMDPVERKVNFADMTGTWKFEGWYKSTDTNFTKKLKDGDAKVSATDAENHLVGKWVLTETETKKVTRKFVIDPNIMGDGKDVPTGRELPNGVKVAQKVSDTTNYIGSTQTPGKDNFTAVLETINGKQGTWTFKEWNPKTLIVNENESENVFTGTWTWTENDKITVKYVFNTNPADKTLPKALADLKPEDITTPIYEDKVGVPAQPDVSKDPAKTALDEMKDGKKVGKWKVGKWVKTIDEKGNITYTLTWTFEEVKKDKPTPSTPSKPSTPSTPSKPSTPTTPSTTDRVHGKNRIETAIEISKKYYGQAERVIIVDASNFPDAMAASALVKQLKAPILLTNSNNLDSRVAAEIKRLGAHNVTVIGGKSSISDGALNQLSKFDKDGVERISGKDRYETSAQVARRLAKITGKTDHAVIASGEVFADALAVGPYAAREGYPILLVKSNSIPKSISDAITEIGVKKVSIVGGYGSVSKSLEKSLPVVAERLSGKTRYETAIEIASKGLKTSNKAFVANGEHWMDALVIGPVGGMLNMPILLTQANSAPKSLRDHIAKSKIDKITAIGGTSMVSDKVINELSK
ncbi:cell wall-binding repeat-containing protein [Peptostreptococcus anaerobius]|uniref:cell wall-binding repeat-containing protein n=1 Tax=Peptostreptococcus anaerobius TaxID=1261 RepID=UPI00321B96BF